MSVPKMKTFKNANHEAIEAEFNAWAVEVCKQGEMTTHSSEILFSPALQKFVFAVVYSLDEFTTRAG